MLKMSKKLGFILIAGIVISLSCGRFPFGEKLKFSGTLEMTEHNVGAKVSGRIVRLNTDEGGQVKRDELLAVLDRYDQTQKDYERLRSLHEAGGASDQSVELAQLAFEDQKVVSPVDGVVLVKVHEAGEVVSAGSPVLVIGDRSRLWVRVYVPEGQINHVQLGQKASLRFDGLNKTYHGHVSYVAPQAEFTPRNVQTAEERVTQTIAVKVMIDDAEDVLRPGIAAEVTLHGSRGRL